MQRIRYTELSVFWEIYRELKNEYQMFIRSIELFQRNITENFESYLVSLEEKKNLLGRQLTDPDEINDMLRILENDDFIRRKYPSLFYQSMIIYSFSKHEDALRRLAKILLEVKAGKSPPLEVKKLDGYLDYLKENGNVKKDRLPKEYSIVNDFQRVRNFLAHYYGYFDVFKADKSENDFDLLMRIIRKEDSLHENYGQILITDKTFILNFLNASKKVIGDYTVQLEEDTGQKSHYVHIYYDENGGLVKQYDPIK